MKRSLVLLVLLLLVVTACETPTPQTDAYDIQYNFVGFVGQKPHQQSFYLSAQVVPGDKFYENQRAVDYLFQLFQDVKDTCPSTSNGVSARNVWVQGNGEISDACWDLLRSETGMRPATRISDKLLAELIELEANSDSKKKVLVTDQDQVLGNVEEADSDSKKKVLVTDQGQVLGNVEKVPVNWGASCAKEMLKWAGYDGGEIMAIDPMELIDDDTVYKHMADEGAGILLKDSESIPNFCYDKGLQKTTRPDWIRLWQIVPNEYNLTITDSNGRAIEAKFTVGEDGRILVEVEAVNIAYRVRPTNPIMLWTRGETNPKYVYVMFSPSGQIMWYQSLGGEGFQGPGAIIISPEVDNVIPFVSGFTDLRPYYLLDSGELVIQRQHD